MWYAISIVGIILLTIGLVVLPDLLSSDEPPENQGPNQPSVVEPPDQEEKPDVELSDRLSEKIPHREILKRNGLTDADLVRRVSNQTSGNPFYEDIDQIGRVRGSQIEEWLRDHAVYQNILRRYNVREE